MKKFSSLLLYVILLGGFVVRLYHFSGPIADWHSWRQADTAAVTRNFIKYGVDVLHPRMNNISNVQSGLENPQGYFMAEFPLYNVLAATGYTLFHHFTIEEWGRLVSILGSLLGIWSIYFLTKKHADELAATVAAFFYAFLPFAIYYGRTTLPDSLGIGLLLFGLYWFDRWLEKTKASWGYLSLVLSILMTASGIMVRPHVIFFAPVFLFLAWSAFGFSLLKKWQLYLFLILVLAPFGWWRWWIGHFPEGIPASAWLFNAGNIRFTGAFFYWIFAERLGRLILGYWGLALLIPGLIWKGRKDMGFFVTFFLCSLLYYCVIARGNVQHDYYQYITVPSITVLLGRGFSFFFSLSKEIVNKWAVAVVLTVSVLFTLSFSWYYVRDYFNVNNQAMIEAGKVVDSMTPKDALVVAPLDGDSSFLYQTNRQGWASFEKSLPELITMGADYLVLANPAPGDVNIGKQYKIVASSSAYLLFDLHKKL